jgi:Flp pilus assembly protein TadG
MSKPAKIRSHRKEHGQSMVEVAITRPVLLAITLAMLEMGILFASYIALVNSAREGAFFASTCPELVDSSKDSSTSCTNDLSTTNIERYRARVEGDIIDAIANQLFEAAVQQKDSGCQDASPNNGVDKYKDCLKLDRPVSGSSLVGTNITVTVHYRVHTFTSDMSLPSVGRFGLPNYYQIDYSIGLPIRSGQ